MPAGAFAVAGIAAVAGTRWALAGPALTVIVCTAGMLALVIRSRRTVGSSTA